MFSVADLFLAGIGLDIAGGYLVSRGLLARVPQLLANSATIYAHEQSTLVARIDDRIRGTVGLVALVLGFTVQASAYALTIGGAETAMGTGEALTGITVAVGVALGVIVGEALVHPRWRRTLLLRAARYNPDTKRLQALPLANVLLGAGKEMGNEQRQGEDAIAYSRRVFGCEAGDTWEGASGS